MTTRIVELGAPSLTGKDANQLVSEVFRDAKYPLAVEVQNHMPRAVSFPEVPGLFLRHVSHETESKKNVRIESYDLFQRLASSIEQIASLNLYKLAVTITAGEVVTDGGGDKAPAGNEENGAGAADGAGDSGGQSTAKPSDGLSYEQLKEALKAKGIEFHANAKKTDLVALLDAAPAADAVAGNEANGAGGGQPAATA